MVNYWDKCTEMHVQQNVKIFHLCLLKFVKMEIRFTTKIWGYIYNIFIIYLLHKYIIILKNKRPTWCQLLFLFLFLRAQHVSDINISIIRSLWLFCWITTLFVLFLVRCVLEFRCGWVGVVSVSQVEAVLSLLMCSTCFGH